MECINETPKRNFGYKKVIDQTAQFIERQLQDAQYAIHEVSIEAKQKTKHKTNLSKDEFYQKFDKTNSLLIQNGGSTFLKKKGVDPAVNFRSVMFPTVHMNKFKKGKMSPWKFKLVQN